MTYNRQPTTNKIRGASVPFAFFGTPSLAVELLDALKSEGFIPAIIITTPDKPVGRKMLITPPPVKTWAIKNNIEYLQPTSLIDPSFIYKLSTINYQLALVVAYGKILPQNIIDLPKLGTFNIHYSLLPRYRGATPVESAILNGDTETGVSIQKMVFELDAGDVVVSERTEIKPDETAPELRSRLNEIAKCLLTKTVREIISGKINPQKQDPAQATFCHKIKKEDGLIDLLADPKTNYLKYRAYFGWPGTYFFTEKAGKQIRVIIKKASFKDGQFVIERVIPEGKKEIPYLDFLAKP